MRKHILNIFWVIFLAINLPAQQILSPNFSQPTELEYTVQNIEELNSSQLDYCAVPFRNGIVFTSTRNRTKLFGCDADFARGHYSDLYFSEKDQEGFYMPPRLLEGDVNGKYHDGACTFTNGQTHMIFSRNNTKGSNRWGTIDLKIYEGDIRNGLWTNVKELPFNSDEFATCHPTMTSNGTWLYFSSNRPGGYGGMDIYVVEKKLNGWGTPVNLGAKVNTSGNEVFPFISASGILYWSSNGHSGLGGLDVYSMPISNGEMATRHHLPEPINSPFDDFGFSTNKDGSEGFLTSNRGKGMGKDDIYAWKKTGQKPSIAHICVVDERTEERIQDAYLSIQTISNDMENAAVFVGEDGQTPYMQMQAKSIDGKDYTVLVPFEGVKKNDSFTQFGKSCGLEYPIVPDRYYEVTVDKPGYMPVKRRVSGAEILTEREWLIPIKRKPPIAMSGEVKDKYNDKPIPFADVKITNNCNGQSQDVIADRTGNFTFPMDCSCDYEVAASKGNYQQNFEIVYSYDIECENDNQVVLLYLEKIDPKEEPEPDFEVGMIHRLDDLYYDYDKHFIRADAALELRKVVDYMKKYPSLEIELRSHTDSRGSDDYNRALSQRRAQAAVDYIVSRGIAPTRLKAAGYGEDQLVNHCGNDIDCGEQEHQENRRTEIKVTKFEEKGVIIKK